jgi:hypothetical protein
MPQPSWVTNAERGTGQKWKNIDPFTRLQYQLATPMGRIWYYTPVTPQVAGRERLSDQPNLWRRSKYDFLP